ncbi:hypothetical protein [Nioella halotolerans]|uniref:hypothetical protein n=1 Tax=Nioella halotolerans TaxID=2303578 RepID=UPI003F65FAA2
MTETFLLFTVHCAALSFFNHDSDQTFLRCKVVNILLRASVTECLQPATAGARET